jgi:SAM-dependent methyltransferase
MPELPPAFLEGLERLALRYLESSDPRLQSGFGGGPERWRAEREPILEAVARDGTLLDVGCANGFLLECLVAWGAERGVRLVPHGLDFSPELVELAQTRLPEFRSNLYVGNAWSWSPPRRFTYVYNLADVVPATHLGPYLQRVLREFLEDDGRLIVGSYGSHSRGTPPLELDRLLPSFGLRVAGAARAGPGEIVRFAWVDRASA